MQQRNTIRISGSETFVKEAGDTVVDTFNKENYVVTDGGIRDSRNPKYKGNFIRYITLNEKE